MDPPDDGWLDDIERGADDGAALRVDVCGAGREEVCGAVRVVDPCGAIRVDDGGDDGVRVCVDGRFDVWGEFDIRGDGRVDG